MSSRSALLVTSFQKSLGESYTLSRFAADLRATGWETPFLASPFAARFLERQEVAIEPLTRDREVNRATLAAAVGRWRPRLLVSVDPYLYHATDARQWWSIDWLLETGIPVLAFDHLKFHPEERVIRLAFLRRFLLDPSLAGALAQVPPGAQPRPVVQVPALPQGVALLVRPCPVHHPEPEPARRIVCYDMTRTEAAQTTDRQTARRALGIPAGHKVVVVPAGSWAMELAQVLRLPYPHLLGRLLLRYLAGAPAPVHLFFVGGGLEAGTETHGRSTLRRVPGLPFQELCDLLAAADLVLGDNASSATLGRAVMAGVTAVALLGSVRARREGERIELEAPFPLTPYVRDLLAAQERKLPGAVFPFAVYPLGWCEEMQPLFAGNLYSAAIEWMELYDEETTRLRLLGLLFDAGTRQAIAERQDAYRRRVRSLPGATAIAEAALSKAIAA